MKIQIINILLLMIGINNSLCSEQFIKTDNTKLLSILNDAVYSVMKSKYGEYPLERVQNKLIEIQEKFPNTCLILKDIKVQFATEKFAYFINDKEKKDYLVVRGTNLLESEDIINDIGLTFIEKIPKRILQINAFINNQIKNNYYRGYNTTISGHSLGGTLSIIACIVNKWIRNCEVHNPYLSMNILDIFELYHDYQLTFLEKRLLIQRTKGDVVSYLTLKDNQKRLFARLSIFEKVENSKYCLDHSSLTLFGKAALEGSVNYQLCFEKVIDFSRKIKELMWSKPNEFIDTLINKIKCPSGFICQSGQKPIPCQKGTFKIKGVCQACQSGYYADKIASTVCLPCPNGYVCKDPSFSPSICPKGQVNIGQGNIECYQCQDGYYLEYSSKFDLYQCLICPPGHFCESGKPIPCPPGYFSSDGQGTCTQCESGLYQTKSGQLFCIECPPGYSCKYIDQEPIVCSPGYVSSGLQTECNQCDTGYFQSKSGQFFCLMCPPGYSCKQIDQEPVPCAPDSVSSGEQIECNQCNEGYYQSQQNSLQIVCPPGSVPSEFWKDKCSICNPGYYQPQSGQSVCIKCPQGHICPDPTDKPIPCPPGSVPSTFLANKCANCNPGYYQPQNGQKYCIKCPKGHICLDPAKMPIPCPSGSVHSQFWENKCSDCKPGYYQLLSGQVSCIKCPQSHTCSNPAKMPIPCPSGSVPNEYWEDQCSKCKPGYYQPQSGQLVCIKCPPGHICPDPTEKPIPCPPGSVPNKFWEGQCSRCDPGYYQLQSGQLQCIKCPQGHICSDSAENPIPCPPGTVPNPFWINQCSKCDSGYYQPQSGQQYCIECPSGFSCKDLKEAVPCFLGESKC